MFPRALVSTAFVAALVCFTPLGATAQGLADLQVGHWVEAKGVVEDGVVLASEVELLEPEDEQELIGTVERMLSPTRFLLLGQQVHVSAKTKFNDVEMGDLTGMRVKVEGHYRGPRKFSARKIQARDPGREAVEGRIDALRRTPEGLVLQIMKYEVRVQPDAPLELDLDNSISFDEVGFAPLVIFQTSLDEGSRDDDDDLDYSVKLGENLYIGGQLEYTFDSEENFDLNDARRQDQKTHDLGARIETVWEPSENMFLLAGARLVQRWRKDEDDPDTDDQNFNVSELYGYFRDFMGTGWDLQLGRQDFDERREWLYDQNLDALRAIRSTPDWRLELSLSTIVSDGSRRDEDNRNFIAYLSNNDLRKHAAAYAVHRQADADEHATHLGVRAHGEWLTNHKSWVEAAWLTGEDGVDLEGYGFDVGTSWSPADPWLPGLALTAGYAFGSGDDDPTDGDDSFRQTGLQDNNDKFEGVTSFRYYGELFDPELSNLGIATLAVGYRPNRRSSLDLVLHKYDQVEAFAGLSNTELRRRPSGLDEDLGWEADLVFGSRSIDNLSLEIVGGYFRAPGTPFPTATRPGSPASSSATSSDLPESRSPWTLASPSPWPVRCSPAAARNPRARRRAPTWSSSASTRCARTTWGPTATASAPPRRCSTGWRTRAPCSRTCRPRRVGPSPRCRPS